MKLMERLFNFVSLIRERLANVNFQINIRDAIQSAELKFIQSTLHWKLYNSMDPPFISMSLKFIPDYH